MEASSPWASSPELQSATQRWRASAKSIDDNAGEIATLKDALRNAQAKQRLNRRTWEAATQHVLAVATVIAHGDNDVLIELGLVPLTRSETAFVPPPELVSAIPGVESGEVVFEWRCPMARNGYVLQVATNRDDPSTYSPIIPFTRTKYRLKGRAPREMVYLRVAAIDPAREGSQSEWSAWSPGTSR